jgi:lactate dehydrogenase-like 2-hydroxyacid dehydrogenase
MLWCRDWSLIILCVPCESVPNFPAQFWTNCRTSSLLLSKLHVRSLKSGIFRYIATTGPRNAGIDIAYAKTKGVLVSGTGSAGNATLEHIWALILATVRYIVVEDANVKASNPQWQSTMPLGLAGKTLGVVGVGRLGSQTAAVRNTIYNASCTIAS